ncbi:MAG: YkgJ family cysteine cluster protein [Gammaproteobacteria bacterium]|nr:YkgJ family cysteine cluster protein [Gammaproteobacteria bacterium]MBI5617597.1 YkgJ family cysteine cluster protein [Gammaproteobacteria bacterium]
MHTDEHLQFFAAQRGGFTRVIDACVPGEVIPRLLTMAFTSFEGNVAADAEGEAGLACRKGCASCCRLRVVATAPEILLAAHYVRWRDSQAAGPGLAQRVAAADERTRGLDEAGRWAARVYCPFLTRGECEIYPVRPLACRGLASHDRTACGEAAAGRRAGIPASALHLHFRGLIQNALQAALRDAGLAWGLYELNQALGLALQDGGAAGRWLAGEAVWQDATLRDVERAEMAAAFDRLSTLGARPGSPPP